MDLELFLGLKINPKEVQIHLLTPTLHPQGNHPTYPPPRGGGYPNPWVAALGAVGFSWEEGRGEVGGGGLLRERERERRRERLPPKDILLLHLISFFSIFFALGFCGFHERKK